MKRAALALVILCLFESLSMASQYDSVDCKLQTSSSSAIQFSGAISEWKSENGLPVYAVETKTIDLSGRAHIGRTLNMIYEVLSNGTELRTYWYNYDDIYSQQYIVTNVGDKGAITHIFGRQAQRADCQIIRSAN